MTTEKPARRKATAKPAPAPEVEHEQAATRDPAEVEHDQPPVADHRARRGSRSLAEREALLARGCPLGLVDGTDPDAVLID